MLVSARKFKGNISKEKNIDLPNKIITCEDLKEVAIKHDEKSIKSFIENDDWDKLILNYKYDDINIEVIIDNDKFTLCNFSYTGLVFYKGILWFKTIESLSRLLKMLSAYFQENINDYIGG